MAEADDKEVKLSAVFEQGLDLYNNLGKIDEATNSPPFQANVKNAMKLLEDATRLVSMADIFSRNESIEEVSTTNIKYLLLPSLLGSLTLKLTSGERSNILDTADVYFKDFLQRCNDYGLSNYEFKKLRTTYADADQNKSSLQKIQQSVNTRANKIQRYMEQKEIKEKLEILKNSMKNEHIDDEVKRDFYLNMLKLSIYEAIDELSSIEMEKPILEHIKTLDKNAKPIRRPVVPLKPIIITRDEVQKAVFGAGYPSLPTMTVQEFYDQRVRDGIFPDRSKINEKPPDKMSMQEAAAAGINPLDQDEKEKEDKEVQEERDDDEFLARMREKDEFKDEHRRGWGNRMNRS